MPIAGKTGVVEKNPNSKSVKFGDRWINITAIARVIGIDKGYISRIFAGKRGLSLDLARKLAAILSMDMTMFCEYLDKSIDDCQIREKVAVHQLEKRLDKEVTQDLATFAAGSVAAPRLSSISPNIS